MLAFTPAPSPRVTTTLGLSMLMIVTLWPLMTTDMTTYLLPWFDHIAETGPVAAFAAPFSNYTPAYLYLLAAATPFAAAAPAVSLIKMLSVLGSAALALAVRRLLIRLGAAEPDRGAALVFALPTVMLNAAMLGQCDAMWCAPLVMALIAALDRRHAIMLAWCGLALGFKAQAVLVAPFFLALLINRRVPFRLWPIAPLVTAATMLPAWAAGWPAADLATIYLRQADTFADLSLNAPNIWVIVQTLPLGDISLAGLALAAAIGATAAYVAYFSARPLGDRALVAAALLAPLVTAGLLPRMHERYFFLADVLALVLALTMQDRLHWRIALLVQGGSALALLAYISGIGGLAMLGAVAMILATVAIARPLLQPAANDNPLLARAA